MNLRAIGCVAVRTEPIARFLESIRNQAMHSGLTIPGSLGYCRVDSRHAVCACLLIGLAMLSSSGCTRARYRTAADDESYGIIDEKAFATPWDVPRGFSINPDPRSRLYRPDNPDDPSLPLPSPVLYDYDLPNVSERDPNRFRGEIDSGFEVIPVPPSGQSPELPEPFDPNQGPNSGYGAAPQGASIGQRQRYPLRNFAMNREAMNREVAHQRKRSRDGSTYDPAQDPLIATVNNERGSYDLVAYKTYEFGSGAGAVQTPVATLGGIRLGLEKALIQSEHRAQTNGDPGAGAAGFSEQSNAVTRGPMEFREPALPNRPERVSSRADHENLPPPKPMRNVSGVVTSAPAAIHASSSRRQDSTDADVVDAGTTIVPIPKSTWDGLPVSCLRRMLEFESIRQEYELSFGTQPPPELRDDSPRLALEDIVEIGLLNSREFQSQKEALYRTALRLSLSRFDYDLKFASGNNGTGANYAHNRNGGVTVNTLGIPTDVTVDKALVTGGDLLARFANDVVLTFNGPTGFTADVGSLLLLDLSQSLLQRDVVFENLTQSERDVLYAARDFARFRKSFFVQRAAQYYALLQTYRSIEIDSQNYISLVRGFNEAEAEFRATGARSRIEVDQVEQNALSGRSGLIGNCNGLESSLDSLKIAMGIPPETPINLNLVELDQLTLRDEITVNAELVQRARRVLDQERQRETPSRAELLNSASNLANRMKNLQLTKQRFTSEAVGIEELDFVIALLGMEEARIDMDFNRRVLEQERAARPPAPPLRIFQRTMDLLDAVLLVIQREIELGASEGIDAATLLGFDERRLQLESRSTEIREALDLTDLPAQVITAEELLSSVEALLAELDEIAETEEATPEQQQAATLEIVDTLLIESQRLSEEGDYGLVPIGMDMNDAMLTALVQRLDLLNQRGELADTWRRIKLAGDDLRSVLNLNATQTVRTRADVNRAFDFTWDESATRLSLTFDTPLNRRAQRNAYRNSLINYQASLRSLMQLEDDIKADIRDDLRNLQVRREQYEIAVASAALAYERVVSTQLQLRFGTAGVAARDFLEAQQDYALALNTVATQHITYIQNRTQFFLDLESLTVDETGFWQDLYNEQVQPVPRFDFVPNSGRPYGELPPRLRYSRDIRRMEQIPNGQSMIREAAPSIEAGPNIEPGPGIEPVPAIEP